MAKVYVRCGDPPQADEHWNCSLSYSEERKTEHFRRWRAI